MPGVVVSEDLDHVHPIQSGQSLQRLSVPPHKVGEGMTRLGQTHYQPLNAISVILYSCLELCRWVELE